jgi:hypothetical protein
MPIYKPRLLRVEDGKYLDCLRQLQDEGIDVEISQEWQVARRMLEIAVAPPYENMLFNCQRDGNTHYAVWVRLVALQSGLILPNFAITTTWDQITPLYRTDWSQILTLGGFAFDKREVLNPRIADGLRFRRRGDVVEGYLLASGLAPIPPGYRDGAFVPCQVTFIDQFGSDISEQAHLSVSRSSRGGKVTRQPYGRSRESGRMVPKPASRR